MQICRKIKEQRGLGKLLVVGLMLGLWLGTAALAVSPELHQRLHKDSRNVTHECLITLLSKSHLLAGCIGGLVLALMPIVFGLRLLPDNSHFSIRDYRLSPSRAPPFPCPLHMVVS